MLNLSLGMRTLPLAALMAVACMGAANAATCSALRGLHVKDTEITDATAFPGGALSPPGAVTFNLHPLTLQDLPPFCRVSGVSRPTRDSEIHFEVWLPERWNGRYQQMGNGGWAGAIPYESLAPAVRNGFVTAGTDDGHHGAWNEVRWAYDHPEKVIDFGHRALHTTNVAARAVVAAFYGHAPAYAYFNGCSDGGRESLMTAQRYPDDFNGWVVGAPANNWAALSAGFLNARRLVTGVPLDSKQLDLVSAAALKACGARDGIVDDPLSCGFDARTLVCTAQQSQDCLSAEQADVVQKLYDGLRDPGTNAQLVPGLRGTLGTESSAHQWSTWITGPNAAAKDMGAYYQYLVYRDPTFDVSTLDPIQALHDGKARTDSILSAIDPNLSKVRAAGKKIIQFHGWSDSAVAAGFSLNYYHAVQNRMHGDIRDFYRLFMVPGMYHCTAGPGPNAFGGANNPGAIFDAEHDVVAALMAWVEHGRAPEQIIATKFQDDDNTKAVLRTRPLCAYPKHARWLGKGPSADAASYVCEAP